MYGIKFSGHQLATSAYNLTFAGLKYYNVNLLQSTGGTITAVTFSKPIYTVTLTTDGHGTLSANKLTGYAGDTITLSPTYNTYYRFSAYSANGCTISNNTLTFGSANCTAKATFKTNTFTASGAFNTKVLGWVSSGPVQLNRYYPYLNAGVNCPTAWYNTNSLLSYSSGSKGITSGYHNSWKPSGASGYKFSGYVSAVATPVNSIANISAYFKTSAGTNYATTGFSSNATQVTAVLAGTTTVQGTPYFSAYMSGRSDGISFNNDGIKSVWSASGYAP